MIPDKNSLEFVSYWSKCKKFGNKSLTSGKIVYDSADQCRSDINKCGPEGIHFEEDKQLWLREWKHRIKVQGGLAAPFILIGVTCSLFTGTIVNMISKFP
jgi:hypothetical protein